MDQALREMGLDGGVAALHHFYQTRVLGAHDHALQTCRDLLDEYERCKNPELRAAAAAEEKHKCVQKTGCLHGGLARWVKVWSVLSRKHRFVHQSARPTPVSQG